MSFREPKKDKYGQDINPGDVCVWDGRLCVYRKHSWGAKGISKGEYGKFITPEGIRTVKYTSVIFAFDPMGKRRNQSTTVKELCREFYEGK